LLRTGGPPDGDYDEDYDEDCEEDDEEKPQGLTLELAAMAPPPASHPPSEGC
jgi:hypothetical protein